MPSSNPIISQVIVASVLGAASLAIGFYLGSRSISSPSPRGTISESTKNVHTETQPEVAHDNEDEESEEDEEDEGDIADGDLSAINAGFMEPCKLVLVVRTDLKMTPGKVAAQCGHATLACYKALVKRNPKLVQHWENTGQAKIALKATSEDQMLELEAIAKSLNLCARVIQDQGRTQVAEGSRTVLGIGPAPVALVNQVTGNLRLL